MENWKSTEKKKKTEKRIKDTSNNTDMTVQFRCIFFIMSVCIIYM